LASIRLTLLATVFLAGFEGRRAGLRTVAFEAGRTALRAGRLNTLLRPDETGRAFEANGLRAGGFLAGFRWSRPDCLGEVDLA